MVGIPKLRGIMMRLPQFIHARAFAGFKNVYYSLNCVGFSI